MYRYKSVRLLRRVRGYKVYFFLTNVLAIFILLGTKVGNVFMDHPVYGYLIFAGGLAIFAKLETNNILQFRY